jgi:glutamate-1-semialdehyde 2,1-aminomutase
MIRRERQWPSSEEAWLRAKKTLGGGISSGMRAAMRPHPLYFERGEGSKLWDIDGNDYIDYVLGWGPVILGHSHPAVTAAVGRQLEIGQDYGACHRAEYEVSEKLCSIVPGLERVLWSNSGSEADQTAIRLARAVTGRQRILKFAGHYHGWSDQLLIGYRPDDSGKLDSLGTRGQSRWVLDDVELVPWNDIDACREAITNKSNDIAAVICEPVLCNSGVIPPKPGFLEELRSLCTQTATILIFDEVITGFRLSSGGAVSRFGVTPDLIVYAKAIANGFSLAAIGGKGDLIDEVMSGVVHAGTYNGNPIALAAASATLGELGLAGTYERLENLAWQLATGMARAFETNAIPGTAHHVGPIVQCSSGREPLQDFGEFLKRDWAWYDRLSEELLKRGVFIMPGGRWYISTAHTEKDIRITIDIFDDALTNAGRPLERLSS